LILVPVETTLEQQIVDRLRPLGVWRVILFGSQAWGTPEGDSDIDLLVVLDEEESPGTSDERGSLHKRVARRLRDLERSVPIDLIVHTRPMHRQFCEYDSMFSRKVRREGQILYEKSD
jgi:predicted nucleotidyltransferase